MSRRLTLRDERWPLAAAFVIARGAKTEAHVIVAEIAEKDLGVESITRATSLAGPETAAQPGAGGHIA